MQYTLQYILQYSTVEYSAHHLCPLLTLLLHGDHAVGGGGGGGLIGEGAAANKVYLTWTGAMVHCMYSAEI